MEIKNPATAGTMESSDIMVTLTPVDHETSIELESSVEKQFGDQIRDVIRQTLDRLGITKVDVSAVDKGALDCTIKARTVVAAYRAAGKTDYSWEDIDEWIN